jgi:hypothetical protein
MRKLVYKRPLRQSKQGYLLGKPQKFSISQYQPWLIGQAEGMGWTFRKDARLPYPTRFLESKIVEFVKTAAERAIGVTREQLLVRTIFYARESKYSSHIQIDDKF